MKFLIAGLGNIGSEYELTRHNVGFLALDRLADVNHVTFTSSRYADKAEMKHKGKQIHLIKPTTYMNLSGKAIAYWMQELKIPKERLLVVMDDIALPFGTLRMRKKGSSAGHNGLRSVEELTGGQDYPRLRIGIGNEYGRGQQVDYVLSNFSQEEFKEMTPLLDRCSEMILSFCTIGIDRTMSQYNS